MVFTGGQNQIIPVSTGMMETIVKVSDKEIHHPGIYKIRPSCRLRSLMTSATGVTNLQFKSG